MFPGVDGFHWSFGHLVFLSLFFAVVLAIATTVTQAVLRVSLDFRSGRAAAVCWRDNFDELPEAERRCRHELAGRVEQRTCPNAFDCRHCAENPRFAALPARAPVQTYGLSYPQDRLYHRGHTWVHPEEDGTLTVGVDDLAGHVIGRPDSVELPARGSEMVANSGAWRMRKNGVTIQARAPIEGTVIDTGGPDRGWYLKLRPHGAPDFRHLLTGPEVSGWLSQELERLQLQLTGPEMAPSLADGGILTDGLMDALPDVDWDATLAGTFLEG
jgi:hypothetical protein